MSEGLVITIDYQNENSDILCQFIVINFVPAKFFFSITNPEDFYKHA